MGLYRFLGVILLGVVIAVTFNRACSATGPAPSPPAVAEHPTSPPPAPPAPSFLVTGRASDGATAEKAADFENLAMRQLYKRCSAANEAWRDGPKLTGEYHHFQKDTFVTIKVDLAHPEEAHGDTLWYQVFFDGKWPAKFQATKTSAAELCGLDEHDVQYDL